MSTPVTGYHFTTQAQWKTCLVDAASAVVTANTVAIKPLAPYLSSTRPAFASTGAYAPAGTRARVTLWRDDAGHLLRAYAGDTEPESYPAPAAIGRATRIVGTGNDLWVAAASPQSLQCFDVESLTRRFVVDLSPGEVLDIAADRADGIVALVREGRHLYCVHVGCSGTITGLIPLLGMEGAGDIVGFGLIGAAQAGVLAILVRGPAESGDRLYWFAPAGGKHSFVTQLALHAPCFIATALVGDGKERLFVAGMDNHGAGPRSHIMIFDAAHTLIGDVDSPSALTGIATSQDALLVTAQSGLYRLAASETVPDSVSDVQCRILTPALEAADVSDGRRWLRVEVVADLPAGTTLQIACAATDNVDVRDRLNAKAAEPGPTGARVQALLAEPDIWLPPIVLNGSDTSSVQAGIPFAAPLHDIQARFLWVCVTVVAGAGASLPAVTRLSVLYPGRTLMQNLPALYQRDEATHGRFLRSLVAVLETTTHTLDDKIDGLGANIHPDSANSEWLDYMASWLGLPWDDTLSVVQKRAIVKNAEALGMARGTRAGLKTLLDCLFPENSRYRLVDFTVDFGMAMVGGESCVGSTLPALLGGLPSSAARLDVQATLGSMRLPCDGVEADPFARFVGRLRVEVAASRAEREQWQPWLADVLGLMVPLTTQLSIHWLAPDALEDRTLGDTWVLRGSSQPRLGEDAVTGQASLPDGQGTLPSRATRRGFTLH